MKADVYSLCKSFEMVALTAAGVNGGGGAPLPRQWWQHRWKRAADSDCWGWAASGGAASSSNAHGAKPAAAPPIEAPTVADGSQADTAPLMQLLSQMTA